MAQVLIEARPDGYDAQLDTPDLQGTHPPLALTLRPNCACLQLHLPVGAGASPIVLGAHWLGISRRGNVHKPAEVLVVKPGRDGGARVAGPATRWLAGSTFRHPQPASGAPPAHDGCSEVALLNLLHEVLQHHRLCQADADSPARLVQTEPDDSGDQGWAGHLYLLTERAPCTACTAMLAAFLRRYTNLAFTLGYMFEASLQVPGATAPLARGIEDFRRTFQPGRSTETYLAEIISPHDRGRPPAADKPAPWSPADYQPAPRTDWSINLLRVVDGAGQVMHAPGLGRAPGMPSVHFAARVAPGSC